jgi:hypothetical protein
VTCGSAIDARTTPHCGYALLSSMKNPPIAERRLTFTQKGGSDRKPLWIRIYAPQAVAPSSVTFAVDADTARCVVEFDGLPEVARQAWGADSTVFGADSIQALQLVVDVDRVLRRLSQHYDFYFPTGEPYFDE